MKKLNELIDTNLDLNIEGITDDSRLVKKNYIFVTTKGYNVDHYDYISDAIKRGAVFIITDRKIDFEIPHLIVDNIDEFFKETCLKYYDIDLNYFRFIGVTGTDGKTTTATIISTILGDCAYLGTNGLTINNKTISINNTTPCIPELYEVLEKVRNEKTRKIVMEVSSESLLHQRVNNILFDAAVFTNITGDHLNIHKTFENYLNSKLKLLDLVKEDGYVIINGDDLNLKSIKHKNRYSFGFNIDNDFIIDEVDYKDITEIVLKYKNTKYKIISPLKGQYNVYNVVSAFVCCLLLGVDSKTLIEKIKALKPITGRGEFLDFGQEFDIVLDYAHTTNGIRSILSSFKAYKYNRIITVTGAAGGREKEKRKIIGKIVMHYSDVSIFTMDDPRYEDVNDIIDQMVGEEKDYIRIIDRKEAIKYAFDIAEKGDIVLILGKGRDNYMAIEDKKIKYNDYEVIKKYFD